MPTLAVSAHGTLVDVQLTPGGAWVQIAEQGDITPPATTRNEFDATTQEKDIDSYVLGVYRRGQFTEPLHFLPTNNTQDHLTGLYKLQIDNTVTGFRIRYPAVAGGVHWIMSGQVQGLVPGAPVDGKLSLNMTLRFSGAMQIGVPPAMTTIGAGV
jgi:tail tube protein